MPDAVDLRREWQDIRLSSLLGELPPLRHSDRVYLPGTFPGRFPDETTGDKAAPEKTNSPKVPPTASPTP
jgi:hypothetical protein